MGGWRIQERGLVQGRWLNTPGWKEEREASIWTRGCILNNESWEPPVKASARERGCKGACATHREINDGPRQACQRRLPFPQSHPKAPGLEGQELKGGQGAMRGQMAACSLSGIQAHSRLTWRRSFPLRGKVQSKLLN